MPPAPPAQDRGQSPGHGSPHAPPGVGPILPGEGATDYERYMKVDALLALQKPLDQLVHHDELLFQTVHQSSELWFRQIVFEMESAARLMEEEKPLQAANLARRCTMAIRTLTDQVHILETMSPWDFHEIRRHLGRGSGAESPGFRRILARVPPCYKPFQDLLARRKVDLVEVHTHQDKHYDLFHLAEALTDFDMFFHLWREDHLAMVKRVIGRDVKSLKGYAVHQLEQDVQQVLFPELWMVRNKLTELAGTSPS